MMKVAVLGLGAMGRRMASRLLDAGHDVTVFNRTEERARALVKRGARLAATPRLAADGCDAVISMVRDDDAARDVWLAPQTGALAGLAQHAVAIESSTLSLATCAALSGAAANLGRMLLDAPVVGTRPQAEAGTLVHLVGGDKTGLQTVRPLLTAMGSAIHFVGPSGAGMAMKLAVNALFGIQVAALAETSGILQRAGIDHHRALAVLSELAVTSPAMKGVGSLMANDRFAPMFPVALVEKDFGYVTQAAAELHAAAPLANAARSIYQTALQRGLADDNISGVVKLYRD